VFAVALVLVVCGCVGDVQPSFVVSDGLWLVVVDEEFAQWLREQVKNWRE
jgi:hypothetical protein